MKKAYAVLSLIYFLHLPPTGFGQEQRPVSSGSRNPAPQLVPSASNGKYDFVALLSSSLIEVRLGDGTGAFSAAPGLTPGVSGLRYADRSIVTGDFNGDNKPDVAACDQGASTISVFLGNGDGTFATRTAVTVGSSPGAIAVMDFNRDGRLDLAVANSGSNNVSILRGNGNGGFVLAQTITVGASPQGIAVADLNQDELQDIVVANSGTPSNLSILSGSASGTFSVSQTITPLNPEGTLGFLSVALADFNQDQNIDIAAASNNDDTIYIFEGDGTGTFSQFAEILLDEIFAPVSLAVGDFDRKNGPDLAVANNDIGGVTVHLNTGNGSTFIPPLFIYLDELSPNAVIVADIDGDGDSDILASNFDTEQVLALGNDGTGNFALVNTVTLNDSPIAIAHDDLNGDRNDITSGELGIDDNRLPDFIYGFADNIKGFGWFNQLTPSNYPVTLEKVKVRFADDVTAGYQVRVVVYTDPDNNGPDNGQSPLFNQIVSVARDAEGWSTYEFGGTLTLSSGSVVVGVIDNAGNGIKYPATASVPGLSSPPGSRSFESLDSGASFRSLFSRGDPGISQSFLLRGVLQSTGGSAPTVTTSAATNVSATATTLNGTVNPNGLTTTPKFQYGVTTSYGSEVTTGVISGNVAVPVNAIISNLTPNTLYHYRVVATNSAGTTNGADQTFTTASAANRTPTVANAISNQTLTAGGASFTRNLNASPAVFNDPDGDALTYTASSSATGVATASISGSTLTVAPVAAGSATITVTANDGRGGTVSTNFTATVIAGNRAPTVANAISNQTLTVGGASFTRNLNASPAVFNDPDGDALTFTASSSATNIATASISGSTLTVAPVAAGSATITVTANDGKGGTVSTNFTATVTAANRPPVVANTISSQTLTVGGALFTRDLNLSPPVFTDPDGDVLIYTASSNTPAVATVAISGSSLTVTPVSSGTAAIMLTANDGRGGSVSTSFNLTVNPRPNQPPLITHTQATQATPGGQQIQVQANISDDTGVASATLNYRKAGDPAFTATPMATSGSLFLGTIPAGSVTSRGVEYFIQATDLGGLTARQPATGVYSHLVQISTETKPAVQPNGSAQTAYRLISIPVELNTTSAASVLEDNLGAYDNTVWRLFGLPTGQLPYVEYPNAGNFAPGKSLFLIVRDPGKVIDAGPGQSVRTHQQFGINLVPGHNFIGSPFLFPIPSSKLQRQSGDPVVLRTYTGSWVEASGLTPWEGYYLANNRSTSDMLLVNPDLSSGALPLAASQPGAGNWRIRILASCAQARDNENFAGVAWQSEDGHDRNDLAEPPPIGEFVSLYFPHPEWQKPLSQFSDDLRSAANPNQQWHFRVATNIPGETILLQFDRLQTLPHDLAVFLVDETLNYKQNLRENAVYQYQPRHLDRPNAFTLIAGKEAFVSEQTAAAQGTPEDFVLEQNFPNPFGSAERSRSPETGIRFGLPERSVVTIKIFDLAGREIATLLDRAELPAGRHQRVWDGRDSQGQALGSGIYFYQLLAGSFSRTMKLMLVR